jgi:hypothetical protein
MLKYYSSVRQWDNIKCVSETLGSCHILLFAVLLSRCQSASGHLHVRFLGVPLCSTKRRDVVLEALTVAIMNWYILWYIMQSKLVKSFDVSEKHVPFFRNKQDTSLKYAERRLWTNKRCSSEMSVDLQGITLRYVQMLNRFPSSKQLLHASNVAH